MPKAVIPKHAHYVVLTFQFEKREDNQRWLAQCLELGTATDAETLEQAQTELIDLVELHLNALEEHHERDKFFQENNIPMYVLPPPRPVTIQIPTDIHIFSQSYLKQLVET